MTNNPVTLYQSRPPVPVTARLVALNGAANRHGSDHELSTVCSQLHSELPALVAEIRRLRSVIEGVEDVARAAVTWAPSDAQVTLTERLEAALNG